MEPYGKLMSENEKNDGAKFILRIDNEQGTNI